MTITHYHSGFNKEISYKMLKRGCFATETQKHKKKHKIFLRK